MTETGFNIFTSRGTEPHFSQPRSTRNEPATPPAQPEPEQSGLIEWLASPEARRFEGRWVLLSDEYDVVDVDDSPSALMDRHPEERTPIIVFVRQSNVTYVV
jgi:hypothetical protein